MKIFLVLSIIFSNFVFLSDFVQAKEEKTKNERLFKRSWSRSLETGKPSKAYFPEVSSPHVSNGVVYIGTHSGKMYALNESNGEIIWKFESSGPIASQANSRNGKIFFGNNKGDFYSLDGSSGEVIWSLNLAGEILDESLIHGNHIFLSTSSNEIFKIALDSGSILWRKKIKVYQPKFTIRGNSAIIYDDGFLYMGFSDGSLAKISASKGEVIWKQVISPYHSVFKDIDLSITKDEKHLYASGHHGRLVKVNPNNGDVVWNAEYSSNSNILNYKNLIIMMTPDSHVLAIDKKTSFRVWDRKIPGKLSHPVLKNKKVFFTTSEGRIYVLDALLGETVQEEEMSFSAVGKPFVGENGIYVLSDNGQFLFLRFLRSL